MKNRKDEEGWDIKVTRLGDGRYGVRCTHKGKEFSAAIAETRADIGDTIGDLLRWVDKLGFDSPMANASRTRRNKPSKLRKITC